MAAEEQLKTKHDSEAGTWDEERRISVSPRFSLAGITRQSVSAIGKGRGGRRKRKINILEDSRRLFEMPPHAAGLPHTTAHFSLSYTKIAGIPGKLPEFDKDATGDCQEAEIKRSLHARRLRLPFNTETANSTKE